LNGLQSGTLCRMTEPSSRSTVLSTGVAGLALVVTLAGCASPFDEPYESQRALQERVVSSIAEQLGGPESPAAAERTLDREPSGLDFSDERLAELNEMAGLSAVGQDAAPPLNENLLGDDTPDIVAISLEEAALTAVRNNLDARLARFEPAVSEQELIIAEAAFDFVFFAEARWIDEESPAQVPSFGGAEANISDTVIADLGLRKLLRTGGTVELSTQYRYVDDASEGFSLEPDPAHFAAVTARLEQPLLRGFGSDATLAEVRLNLNAREDAVELLRQNLLDVLLTAERAYWQLYAARERLMIQQRLLERGVAVKDILQRRLEAEFDVRPAEFSDAVARVEQRRGDIISAQNQLRQASDQLKLVMNSPEYPITGETLLVASDAVTDVPITYSLFDAIASAVELRPIVRRSALAVDARRITLDVAEDGLLPDLNLTLQAELEGLDTSADGAYEEVFGGDFVSTVVGLAFQRALGNRAEEAEFTRARLLVASALTSYQQAVRRVIDDVKSSLRDVDTAYRLIEQSRASRLAAAENLRTLLVEKELTRALTADFLDLEFTRQEALARAELAEVQALIDYAIAIAELDASTGTALRRRGVTVTPPEADELLGDDPLFPLSPSGGRE